MPQIYPRLSDVLSGLKNFGTGAAAAPVGLPGDMAQAFPAPPQGLAQVMAMTGVRPPPSSADLQRRMGGDPEALMSKLGAMADVGGLGAAMMKKGAKVLPRIVMDAPLSKQPTNLRKKFAEDPEMKAFVKDWKKTYGKEPKGIDLYNRLAGFEMNQRWPQMDRFIEDPLERVDDYLRRIDEAAMDELKKIGVAK